ncbi:hypothetical protein VTL71DRAFT_4885 [Oculimacula yallundae]|uniref:Uncharacterized protein n=1 Tax=Oculimacula yallundae TaxID=86028 RepID=A0ABR4C387_9HELO
MQGGHILADNFDQEKVVPSRFRQQTGKSLEELSGDFSTYGVQLFSEPYYQGYHDNFLAYPDRCLSLPRAPNFRFASARVGSNVASCKFYSSPGCLGGEVLAIGTTASSVETWGILLVSFKCF